jgi:hypothetical protein
MIQKLERNIAMTFRVTEKERDMIRKRQAETGILSQREYLLRMAADGLVVRVETDGVMEMNRLLSNATNNINQIARRVNETGSVYSADMEFIKSRLEEIWGQQKDILKNITKLMDKRYGVEKSSDCQR